MYFVDGGFVKLGRVLRDKHWFGKLKKRDERDGGRRKRMEWQDKGAEQIVQWIVHG